MATVEVEITQGGWQDLITLGSLSLTENEYYTLTILSNGTSHVAIGDSEPEVTGHPVKEDENFGFTYKGEKVWVKLSNLRPNVAKVEIS